MTDVTQVRDSAGTKINPSLKENQYDLSSQWQTYLLAGGTIKAEVSGKRVVCTDIWMIGLQNNAINRGHIRLGGAAGSIILTNVTQTAQRGHAEVGFTAGVKGAAYDGAGAGNLYWDETDGDPQIFFAGFMVDA